MHNTKYQESKTKNCFKLFTKILLDARITQSNDTKESTKQKTKAEKVAIIDLEKNVAEHGKAPELQEKKESAGEIKVEGNQEKALKNNVQQS